jgi:phage-Barnase-EndoU-ColicinE5/D-RelE like nuclease1
MSRVDDVAAELIAEQEQNSQLRLDDNVRMSLNTDAEKRLKAEHLAQVIGEPDVDFVERNYATVERSARTRGLYNALPADSVTRNILSDPRERASLPDAENLAKIEGSITSFGIVPPAYRKGQDVRDSGKLLSRLSLSGADDAAIDLAIAPYDQRMDSVQYGDLNWAQRIPAYTAEMAGLYSRMLPDAGMAAAYAGAGAGMAAGPGVVGPAAFTGFKIGTTKEMFEVEQGHAFNEFRKLKFDATGLPVDRDAALGASVLVGGINAGLEFLGFNAAVLHAYGLPQLIKSLGKGGVKNLLNNPAARDAFSKIGQDYAVGVMTEGTTEALQELAKIGFGDLVRGAYSSIETYGARMMDSFQAGAGGAVGIAAPGAAIRTTNVALDNRKQKQQQDAIAALGEDIKTSKLYSNAPKKFQEFIRNIQARHGTVDTVYMDAEAAQTYFQSIDPQTLEKDMPETAIALREAMDTGGYVAIPLDEFVTYVAPNMADVSQDITFDPLTPTQRQYQEIESKAKELQDWYEKTQGQIDSAEDPVYGQVYTELLGAGRKADVAEKEAMLFTTMIRRMAERVGMDPEEYYRSKKISIRGELIQQEGIDVPTATGGLINLLREGRGPQQKDVFGPSLIEFLMGTGILDEGGELSARDLEKQIPAYGRRRLARESGIPMSEAFERARDAGYLDLGDNTSEENALLAAIDRELGGDRVYSPNQISTGAQELDTALEQLRELIDREGLSLETMTNEEIMDRLGITELEQPADPSPTFKQAMDRLLADQSGEIEAALYNPAVGPIDIIWGEKGSGESFRGGYGLAKILAKHPEIDPYHLESIIASAKVVSRDDKRVVLETENHMAAIRLDWHGEKKTWLVTAFEPGKGPMDNGRGSNTQSLRTDANLMSRGDGGSGEGNIAQAGDDGKKLYQMGDTLFQPGDKTKPRGYLEVSPQRLAVTLTKAANLSTFIHESGHLFLELMKDAVTLANADPQLLADWETVKAYLGIGNEPPLRAGNTRVYHSGSQGEGETGRWVSTDRTYAANYRADLPLFYIDIPVDDPRANNPDYADQGVEQGFTFNFELTPQEAAQLVEISRGNEITREQHETFARSFEAYLFEGKAPTKELAGLFSRFKSWLIGVYKTLNKLDVQLTDDIRAVFDRMLVAEASIDRAADDIVPAFKGGTGLSETEINALMELQRQALRAGQDEMEAQAQAEIRAMRTEAYRNRRDALTQEITAKIDAQPVYAVQRLLRTGNDERMTVPGHLLGKKLSSGAVIDLFLDSKVLRRIPGLTRKEGGVHPDVLADLYGFESGYQMVQKIIAAPPRSDVIRNQVQSQLDEEFGNMAQDTETIERAALALHNNAMANFLVAEARAMNRKLGRKDNVTLNQATKEAARRHIARLKLRQVRPHAYYQAELKAARASQEAVAAGKFEEAAQLKQQQLLNHHLYREARMAVDRADLIRRKLKKYDSASVMQAIRKGDPMAANGIEALLAGVELKKTALTQIDARNRLAQYVQAMEAQGETVLIDPALYNGADLVNYKEMTLEQLEALDSSVAALAKQGRDANKVRVEGELVEMAQVIEDLDAVASANLTAKQINQYDVDHRSPLTKAFSSFLASLRKIEFECRFADGDIVGKWHRTIFQPFVDAQNAKEEMLSTSVAELQSIMGTLSRQDAQRLNQSINFLGTTLNRGDLYVVALNMGNEGNWDRLFSRRWKGQERQVLAKLQDELTLEDFRRIEALGQMIDRMYEPMAAVSERVDGIRPPKVEAKPLYLAKYGIELSGWYYPVKYQDAIGTREASVLEESNSIDMGPSPITGQVSKSMTKSRMTGAGGVISLDFAGLPQHLHQVVHYITHYEAVRNFDKLRRKSEFRAMYESYFDANGYKQLRSWLQNIATNGTIAQTSHDASKTMDTIFRRARFGGSLLGLGWKVSSAMMQVLGTGPAAKEVGALNMASWLLKLSYGRVGTMGQAKVHPDYQRALDASPELRHLDSQIDRDIREFTDRAVEVMEKAPGLAQLRWIESNAYYLIIAMQKHINAATWLAAHEKAQGEGRTVAESVQYADATVRQTQSGGGLKDLAGLQQGNELSKLVTLFYTYFSVQHNQLRLTGRQDLIKGFIKGDGPNGRAKSLGKFAAANLYIVLVPSLVEALLKYDEDDDDELLPYLATRIASSYAAGVPIFRDVYSAATRDWQAPSTPLDQVVQSLVKALDGAYDVGTGESNYTDLRNIAKAITLISYVPIYQVFTYYEALATSEDFGEAVSHVLFGTPYSAREKLDD